MPLYFIVGLILSVVIGFSLGLLGGGGSIITVPVLIYVMGVGAHEAVGMSLAVVGMTSIMGTILHYRQRQVKLRIGLLFGATGMLGAYIGSHLTYFLSPQALVLSFAALMFVISLSMLRQKRDEHEQQTKLSIFKASLVGFVVGTITGFLGVGGGFLIVPALVLFGGLKVKDAIGTSLLVISINSLAGLIGHLGHSHFNLRLTLLVTALAMVGTLLGTTLSHRVSAASLRKGFALFVMAMAIFLIAKNYQALF